MDVIGKYLHPIRRGIGQVDNALAIGVERGGI